MHPCPIHQQFISLVGQSGLQFGTPTAVATRELPSHVLRPRPRTARGPPELVSVASALVFCVSRCNLTLSSRTTQAGRGTARSSGPADRILVDSVRSWSSTRPTKEMDHQMAVTTVTVCQAARFKRVVLGERPDWVDANRVHAAQHGLSAKQMGRITSGCGSMP